MSLRRRYGLYSKMQAKFGFRGRGGGAAGCFGAGFDGAQSPIPERFLRVAWCLRHAAVRVWPRSIKGSGAGARRTLAERTKMVPFGGA